MHCPVCKNVNLVMTERSGIEIDYCPTCRGVWLDRGELDKIVERAATPTPPPAQSNRAPAQYAPEPPRHDPYHHEGGYAKKRKREGFLGELFDF